MFVYQSFLHLPRGCSAGRLMLPLLCPSWVMPGPSPVLLFCLRARMSLSQTPRRLASPTVSRGVEGQYTKCPLRIAVARRGWGMKPKGLPSPLSKR